jgi:nucleoside 2-deoxyribosyltransferase
MDLDDSDDLQDECRPLRVYVAARYARKNEMKMIASAIKEAGAILSTDWFNEAADPNIDLDAVSDDHCEAIAERDLNEMRQSDLCISFTEDPKACFKRGGRHNEFGFCLALGIPLWVVGPRETVYHYLPWVEVFDNAQQMLDALKVEASK